MVDRDEGLRLPEFDKWNVEVEEVYTSGSIWFFDAPKAELETALEMLSPSQSTKARALLARISAHSSSAFEEPDLEARLLLIYDSLCTPGSVDILFDGDRALVEVAAMSSRAYISLAAEFAGLTMRVELPQDPEQVGGLADSVLGLEFSGILEVQDAVLKGATLALIDSRAEDAHLLTCTALEMSAALAPLPTSQANLFRKATLSYALDGVERLFAAYPEFRDSPRLIAGLAACDPVAEFAQTIKEDRQTMLLIYDGLLARVHTGALGFDRFTSPSIGRQAQNYLEKNRALYQQDIDSILHALTLAWPDSEGAIRRVLSPLHDKSMQREYAAALIPPYTSEWRSVVSVVTQLRLIEFTGRIRQGQLTEALAEGDISTDPFTGNRFVLEEPQFGIIQVRSLGPDQGLDSAIPLADRGPHYGDDIKMSVKWR